VNTEENCSDKLLNENLFMILNVDRTPITSTKNDKTFLYKFNLLEYKKDIISINFKRRVCKKIDPKIGNEKKERQKLKQLSQSSIAASLDILVCQKFTKLNDAKYN